MKRTIGLLKEYGIGCREKAESEKEIYFSLDYIQGQYELERNIDKIFLQKLKALTLFIEEPALFVEKFNLEEKIDCNVFPLLKYLNLETNGLYARLELTAETGVRFMTSFSSKRWKTLLEKIEKEQLRDFIEFVSPGYEIESVFHKELTEEKLKKNLIETSERMAQAVDGMDLTKIKKAMLKQSIEQADAALKKLKKQLME